MNAMRIFGIILLIIGILLGGVLLAPRFVDSKSYEKPLQNKIYDMTGLDVSLSGDMAFSFLPQPSVILKDVAVSAGRNEDPFASFEKFSLYLSVMPLLSGDVEVNSVSLQGADIKIVQNKEGRYNFETSEIKALLSSSQSEEVGGVSKKTSVPKIYIRSVSINNSSLSFIRETDGKDDEAYSLADLNANIQGAGAPGNYSFDTSARLNDLEIGLKGSLENALSLSQPYSSDIHLSLPAYQAKAHFKGAIDFSQAFEAQGPLALEFPLPDQAYQYIRSKKAPAKIEGIVSGGVSGLDLQDARLVLGVQEYPMTLDIELAEAPKLSARLTGAAGETVLGFAVSPAEGGARVNGNISIGNIPAFAEKSIFRVPALMQDLPWRSGKTSFTAQIGKDAISIEQGRLNVGPSIISYEGTYRPETAQARAVLSFSAFADRFDADVFQKNDNGAHGVAPDPMAALNALALPYDLNFDVGAETLTLSAQKWRGVRATGEIGKNILRLETLSVQDIHDTQLRLSASIDNILSLSGIRANLSVDSADVSNLLTGFGVQGMEALDMIGGTSGGLTLEGDAKALSFITNIDALGGEARADGVLENPITQPDVKQVRVQMTHDNVSKALAHLDPKYQSAKQLAGPLTFYALIEKEQSRYLVKGMQADIAGMVAEGDIELAEKGDGFAISGALNLGDVPLDAWAGEMDAPPRKASASSSKQSNAARKGKSQKARWSREALDYSALQALDLDLSANAKSLSYGPWKVEKPLLVFSLKNNDLTVREFDGQIFDGTVKVTSKISFPKEKGDALSLTLNNQMRGVSMEPLFTALTGGDLLQGKGALNLDAALAAKGGSPFALIYDLQGKGAMTGEKIVLEGVDFVRFARALSSETKPGDTLNGLWKGVQKGGSTAFETLDGEFTVSEGVVDITKLVLDGEKAYVDTKGKVNLPKWTLASTHEVTLKPPEKIPPFTMKIEGPLDNPAQTFGQGALQDYLQRKLSRKLEKILSDKLGLPTANDNAPSNQNSDGSKAIKPEDALRGILQGILQ